MFEDTVLVTGVFVSVWKMYVNIAIFVTAFSGVYGRMLARELSLLGLGEKEEDVLLY